MTTAKRLYRTDKNRILGGVCSGLGEYFNVDPVIFRLIFIILAFFEFSIVFIYFILWIIIPDEKHVGTNAKDTMSRNVKEIQEKIPEITNHFGSRNNRLGWGILLVVLGLYFYYNVLSDHGILPSIDLQYLFPLLVIFAGGWLVFKGIRS
ncbi:PspC domain-containing protein [Candidatus Dojkabacteria bacterium]|uniref:PspC domain-containing protein n=1 Tax=Candidatus Dojkabacteria bacterium TaxID=2099670 RepID=A0A955L1Q8_9BACT|nr:PspC domain-containing protein [Candidatus Dojkabacteria bacterium]